MGFLPEKNGVVIEIENAFKINLFESDPDSDFDSEKITPSTKMGEVIAIAYIPRLANAPSKMGSMHNEMPKLR